MVKFNVEAAFGRLDERMSSFHEDLKEFKNNQKDFNKITKEEMCENTKFRNQAKGVIATVGFVAGALGGLIGWIFTRLGGK